MKKVTKFLALAVCCSLTAVCLFNTSSFAQPGTLDPSFNPTDLGFGFGDGATNLIESMAIQPDGKILIGGDFGNYNSTVRSRIARLNVDGSIDTSFDPGTGANNWVREVVLQPDGKILIIGFFTSYNGVSRNYLARLNANGSLDTGFDPSPGANSFVQTVALQSDGKIIIGGNFTSYNGVGRNRIARLNTDGSLDTSFDPGAGFNNQVLTLAIQPDGKVFAGGQFMTSIARLNTDGSLDTGFNPGTGTAGQILSLALQADGKVLIGGSFISYNGVSRNRIARLNGDGSLDTAFDPGTGADHNIWSMAIRSDGKILIAGEFTFFNGTGRNRIARLNADGTLDTDLGVGADNVVWSVILRPDGKALIGGNFFSYNGVVRTRIAQLNSDGSLEPSFNQGTGVSGLSPYVRPLAIQPNGSVLIGGSFFTYNGTSRNRIVRLNTDGSLDISFDPGTGANSIVQSLALQPDGKIIIGGDFNIYNGTGIGRIARLNVDGSLDSSFDPGTGANGVIQTLVLQPDGKVIIGGSFTIYNGTGRSRIARLNTDGSIDTSFDPGAGASNTVQTIALQPDGKILIGGIFITFNGVARNFIARLNGDGSLDTSFDPGTGTNNIVESIVLQPDGKALIGGSFSNYNGISRFRIARLNSDGTLDASFDPATGANATVFSIALQPDGKIYIGGSFTSFNGTGRNRIARLNEDGSHDTTFDPGTGANNTIQALVIQPDWKVLVGGNLTSYNSTGRNRITRIRGSIPPTPTILSFFPTSGPIGTAVTITGTNYNVIPANNIVKFNGVDAAVPSAASITSLTVTVPSGAPSGTISVTTSAGTAVSTDSFTVTCVPPLAPSAPFVSRCGNGTVSLTASGATGTQEYRWYDVASGGTALSSLATFTTPSLTTTTPFYVSIFDVATSCESTRTQVDAIINTPPSAPVGTPNSGCSGTSISVSATGGSPGQYRWYTAATGGTHDAAQTNDTYATPNLTSNSSYYVAINDGTCESSRTEVIATVIPLPTAPGVQPVNPVCPGSDVTLTATGGTDGQYRWFDGSILITGEVNSVLTTSNLTLTKTFQVAIDDGTCESNKTSVIATVQSCTPPAVASTTATAFIEGIVTIDLEELVTDEEDNIDPARLQITMQPTSGAPATLSGFELSINYAGFPLIGEDQVGIEVCDLTDLCTEQEITIELGGEIEVYNALSPDGNGLNEIFEIRYIDIIPETQSNQVFIYNRWGDEVFSVRDYNNDDRVFKGDSNKGNKLPVGTYFYKIVFNGDIKPVTGFLELKY